MKQRRFAFTGCPAGVRLASHLALLLCALALIGCVQTFKEFAPNETALGSKNDVVVFGRIHIIVDGKDIQDRGHSLHIQQAGSRFSLLEFTDNQPFYAVLPKIPSKDYYYITRPPVRTGRICDHVGFKIPDGADAVYVGTLIFDIEERFFGADIVKVLMKDELETAMNLFKKRNPNYSGKIVKSLIALDKDIPKFFKWRVLEEPGCMLSRGRGIIFPILIFL